MSELPTPAASDTLATDRPIWFAAKRYGWGWGLPVAWQGWVVLVTWTVAVCVVAPMLAVHHRVGFAMFMAAMAAVLIGICYAKGEPPRWRWG